MSVALSNRIQMGTPPLLKGIHDRWINISQTPGVGIPSNDYEWPTTLVSAPREC
jgi:hypothetical protein